MNTDNVWIVALLLILILVGSNFAMFALVRGWVPRKGKKGVGEHLQGFTQSLKQEDAQLSELNQRVKQLQEEKKP